MTYTATRDPIENVVNRQIKAEIRLLLEHEHWTGAVKLIYSGIDTMAFLGMPESQANVGRKDFIRWCERNISFP